MNTIIMDYRTHTYHIQRDGQPVERAKMNPRAAAHIAVILAAAGWQVQHSGLIPTPTAADSERLDELAAVAPEVLPPAPRRAKPPAKPKNPPRVIEPEIVRTLELAAQNPRTTFTVSEVAELLDITTMSVHYHLRVGNLTGERQRCIGAPYAIRPADILQFVHEKHLR